jgi:hypothetical protein
MSYSTCAQEIDKGYISYTLSEKNIRIPIERISFIDENEITIKAYGHITEPTQSTIILSLVLQNFSTDQKDLDTKNCWLSLEHKDNDRESCYISFGFQDTYAYYSSQKESMNDVRKVVTNTAELSILKIENQNNLLFVAGDFASSHSDQRDGSVKEIKIQNGHFTLLTQEDGTTTAAVEEYSGESNSGVLPPIPESGRSSTTSECTLFPTYYFVLSQPFSSPPTEEEPPRDPSSPEPDQVQPPPNNPSSTPPSPDVRRLIQTGRGPIDSNPAPARNDENSKPTRDSGVQRGRQTDSNPAPARNDENNRPTRDSGVQRGRR